MPKDRTAEKTDSGSLAFTATLSNLISQGSNPSTHQSTSTKAKAKTKTKTSNKDDIFTRHNRGALKRAAADVDTDTTPGTGAGAEPGVAEIQRSKRRMEEKTRIYNDLKSGRHLGGSDDEDDDGDGDEGGRYNGRLRRKEREGLVDFDRKFFDTQPEAEDEDEAKDNDDTSIISYEDELGRTRHGTRAEVSAATTQTRQEEEQENRWQPSRPSTLIYGPTVQTEAFNPDAEISQQMSHLAARRDRSATPPSETHYDAEGEVRNRGTGFYAFARDEETRRVQMEELGRVREETLREREGRKERRVVRENAKMERRKAVEELRGRRRAEVFLTSLDLVH